jgi:hypothetical protein
MSLESDDQRGRTNFELDDEEKGYIRAAFFEEVAPKLRRLHARKGSISCEFAGIQYRKWTIQFDSKGSDFGILSFEYDEDAGSIDLDL